MKRTQGQRLLDYLKEHSGASSLEITRSLGIVNVTGRVSDLRAEGNRIEVRRDRYGIHRYYLVMEGQLALPIAG